MSPEQFSDALNYLDDDLILQTDELRQGRRVLHSRPRVLQWMVPAACLALILGIGSWILPGFSGDNKGVMDGNMEMAHGLIEDSESGIAEKPNQQCDCSENVVVQTVTCGSISLYIPDDWTYTMESHGEDSQYIVIRHPDKAGAIRIGYDPSFGVCGTGLTTEETVIAGMRASVGRYDGKRAWSYISFPDAGRGYVVINDGADAWCDEAMTHLESIVIDVD